jgi:hypothetical protein
MGGGVAGVKPDRLPAGSLSLRVPLGVAQGQGESGMCAGQLRVKRDGCPVGSLGLSGQVLPAQAVSLLGASCSGVQIRGIIRYIHGSSRDVQERRNPSRARRRHQVRARSDLPVAVLLNPGHDFTSNSSHGPDVKAVPVASALA